MHAQRQGDFMKPATRCTAADPRRRSTVPRRAWPTLVLLMILGAGSPSAVAGASGGDSTASDGDGGADAPALGAAGILNDTELHRLVTAESDAPLHAMRRHVVQSEAEAQEPRQIVHAPDAPPPSDHYACVRQYQAGPPPRLAAPFRARAHTPAHRAARCCATRAAVFAARCALEETMARRRAPFPVRRTSTAPRRF